MNRILIVPRFVPFAETPIDDIYADGTPYKGADKLKGKVCLTTGGDSGALFSSRFRRRVSRFRLHLGSWTGIGRAFAILAAIEGAEQYVLLLSSRDFEF
jgi:hypothetical protein